VRCAGATITIWTLARKRLAAEYIDLGDYQGLVKWFIALATTRRDFDAGPAEVQTMIRRLDRVSTPRLVRTLARVAKA